MGNTTVKWMTLYRQERKEHQKEIGKLMGEYELKILDLQTKNQWLSNQLIETQKDLRVLTFEIARKEERIDALQQQLRRIAKLGRSAKKKTLVETSVTKSTGAESGDCSKHNLSV